jgi:hypothetical protein
VSGAIQARGWFHAERATRFARAMAALGVAACGTSASAQSTSPPGSRPGTLRPVDQGVADLGPLGIGRQSLQRDLRTSDDFQNLYSFQRTDVFGRQETLFFRRAGAITAVFPRSAYVPTRRGLAPTIPAGTIFYLGDPPEPPGPRARESDEKPPHFVDNAAPSAAMPAPGATRLVLEAPPAMLAPPTDEAMPEVAMEALMARSQANRVAALQAGELSPPPPSIWQDEAYRGERMVQLLRRAVERPTRVAPSDQP